MLCFLAKSVPSSSQRTKLLNNDVTRVLSTQGQKHPHIPPTFWGQTEPESKIIYKMEWQGRNAGHQNSKHLLRSATFGSFSELSYSLLFCSLVKNISVRLFCTPLLLRPVANCPPLYHPSSLLAQLRHCFVEGATADGRRRYSCPARLR